MNETSRYDRIQRDAVHSLVSDFEKKPTGRYLLVIPTGGGKTFTAVKAVNEMYERQILLRATDRVGWVAHRRELLLQARQTFERYDKAFPERPSCRNNVDFLMLSEIKNYVSVVRSARLVVIDEAHHGAANSYQPIFERQDLGVLGLTATPTRHDGRPLDFERESYSIGFPDLVDLGVILRPVVHTVAGGRYDIQSVDSENDLEVLNNEERNRRIISTLLTAPEKYRKVVVYVGSRKHVQDLYEQMRRSDLRRVYDSIGWITGDGNSRSQERDAFLAEERGFVRSVLINIDVLSEGYDDPRINTVVMATPTRSKLVYMQAMGRAIRHDASDVRKQAYVIEVEDELPNIRYRIDNRWLYADISDALEPAVLDRHYGSEADLRLELQRLRAEYAIPDEFAFDLVFQSHYRYSLLLFRVYRQAGQYFHYPVLISNDNRRQVSNMFNFFSERMSEWVRKEVNADSAFRMVDPSRSLDRENQHARRFIFDAMSNAASADGGARWITFVSFRMRAPESDLPAELLKFVEPMVNRAEIVEQITTTTDKRSLVLVRIPLPLESYVGKLMASEDFQAVESVVDRLRELKHSAGKTDHSEHAQDVLFHAVLPLELGYVPGLITIARDELIYSYKMG